MDQNKFLQIINDVNKQITPFSGDQEARQYETAEKAVVGYTEQLKAMQEALAQFSKGNYVKSVSDSLLNFANEVYRLDVDEVIKQKLLNIEASAGSSVDKIRGRLSELSATLVEALNPNINADNVINANMNIQPIIDEMIQSMHELTNSIGKVREEAAKELNFSGTEKAAEALAKVKQEFSYLDNAMQNFYKGIPMSYFEGLIKDTDTFSQAIKKLSEVVNSNAGQISTGLSSMIESKVSDDSGNLFLIKQIESAITSLGKTASGQQGALSKIFDEIMTLSNTAGSGFTSDAVDKYKGSLESAFVQLDLLKQKEAELMASNNDSNKKDPEAMMKNFVELQVVQQKVFASFQDIVRITNSLKLNETFDKKPVEELNNLVKDLGNNIQTVQNTGSLMGLNMPNQISPQAVAQTSAQVASKTLGEKALGLATHISGPAQRMLNMAGLGGLTSASALFGGVFSQDRAYGDLYANSSLYDMIGGHDNYSNQAHLDATSKGIGYATRTNGLIDGFDVESTRRDLTKNVMGQYHQSDANSTADISKLADMSVVFQKGLGISSGDMNSSINTFYKELNMTLPQTEYLMSKIANQAQAMNIPFDKHLKQVESVATQYREMGLGVDAAVNAMNNLMNVQGLNAKDAQSMAIDAGKAIGSMDDGSAAFFGTTMGGFSDPFEAINNYRMGKWNSDGSVNDQWAQQWGQTFADKNKMMMSMGGGGPESQWILYNQYKQAGMTDKDASLFSQTNDPNKITELLKNGGNDIKGAAGGSPQEQAFKDSMDKITQRIEDASNNLSGVTQTMNAVKTAQQEGAKMLHETIKETLEPVKGAIHGITNALDKMDNWGKTMDWLGKVEEVLTGATIALAVAMGANAIKNGIDGARNFLKGGKDVVSGPTKSGRSGGGGTSTGGTLDEHGNVAGSRTARAAANATKTASTVSKVGKFAKGGGLLGTLITAGIGAFEIANSDNKADTSSHVVGSVVGGGLGGWGGAAGGAIAGGAIGALFGGVGAVPGAAIGGIIGGLGGGFGGSWLGDKGGGLVSGYAGWDKKKIDLNSPEAQQQLMSDQQQMDAYYKNMDESKKNTDETQKNTTTVADLTSASKVLNMSLSDLKTALENSSTGGTGKTSGASSSNFDLQWGDNSKYQSIDSLGGMTGKAANIIGKNEGSGYSEVAKNDGGAMSIGAFQWHGTRARDLLGAIKRFDPDQFKDGPSSLVNDITGGSNSLWDTRKLNDEEAAFVKKVLGSQNGQTAQNKLMGQDLQTYFAAGQKAGITDEKALEYFADLYNQRPGSALDIASKSKDSQGNITLDSLYKSALLDPYIGGEASNGAFKHRRDFTYQQLTSGTSSSSSALAGGASSAQTGGAAVAGSSAKSLMDNNFVQPLSVQVGRHSVYGSGIDMNWSSKGLYSQTISANDNSNFNNQEFARDIGKHNFNIYIQASDPKKYEDMAKFFQEKMDQAQKEWDQKKYHQDIQQ